LSYLKSNKGFTLVEVIASVVIMGIILLSLFYFFVNSNKASVQNNEKLAMINIANASLERLKIASTSDKMDEEFSGYTITITRTMCPGQPNIDLAKLPQANYIDRTKTSCTQEYIDTGLLDVAVTVQSKTTNAQTTVEGFVSNAKK
jgi:prepilin-type N-terminal cleavage/methylation domain-containing protein